MALLNYRTEVPVSRSVLDIHKALGKLGAASVMQDFDTNGEVAAIAFRINFNGQFIAFKLPADWQSVQRVLRHQKNTGVKGAGSIKSDDATSKRVAWRIVKDWVEAQAAIIETQMVTPMQVFLPYAVDDNGQTLYERIAANPSLLLGHGDAA